MIKLILILIFIVHMFPSYALPAETHLRVPSQITTSQGRGRLKTKILKVASMFNRAFYQSEIAEAESILNKKLENEGLSKNQIGYFRFYQLAWKAAYLLRKYQDFELSVSHGKKNKRLIIVVLRPLEKRKSPKVVSRTGDLIGKRRYDKFVYNSRVYAKALVTSKLKEDSPEFAYGMKLAFELQDLVKEPGYESEYLPRRYLSSSTKVSVVYILYFIFPAILEISKKKPELYKEFSGYLIELLKKTKKIPYHTVSSENHRFTGGRDNPTSETYLAPIDDNMTVSKVISALQEIQKIRKKGRDFDVHIKLKSRKIPESFAYNYTLNYRIYQSFDIEITEHHPSGKEELKNLETSTKL